MQGLGCECCVSRNSIGLLQYQWAQISQALQDNLDKEHVAICRFVTIFLLYEIPLCSNYNSLLDLVELSV